MHVGRVRGYHTRTVGRLHKRSGFVHAAPGVSRRAPVRGSTVAIEHSEADLDGLVVAHIHSHRTL